MLNRQQNYSLTAHQQRNCLIVRRTGFLELLVAASMIPLISVFDVDRLSYRQVLLKLNGGGLILNVQVLFYSSLKTGSAKHRQRGKVPGCPVIPSSSVGGLSHEKIIPCIRLPL